MAFSKSVVATQRLASQGQKLVISTNNWYNQTSDPTVPVFRTSYPACYPGLQKSLELLVSKRSIIKQ